jgi:hypothetical protein
MLVHSRVNPESFSDTAAWDASRQISKFVAGFDVEYRGGGLFHLVFLHTNAEEANPEGIIYVQSADEGAVWSDTRCCTSPGISVRSRRMKQMYNCLSQEWVSRKLYR